MSLRGKYRAKTLKEKLEILREVVAGKQSKNEIAKKHNIPGSTLSTYIRNKKTIEDSYAAETFTKDRKRLRTAKHPDLEAAFLTWIKEKRTPTVDELQCDNRRFTGQIVARTAHYSDAPQAAFRVSSDGRSTSMQRARLPPRGVRN
ncbi:hypothetical protein HPB49_004505 [Dermacentor silvarum]|uniref:Uncharacterized protein n=1 Tax=Dermacentor silvarum TaxID=543639 RepID=A0ACB8DUY2_DERSI|nr:hypothetical protein HPB49_004505 [Dermacentor silvarum]